MPLFTQYIKDLDVENPPQELLKNLSKTLAYQIKKRGIWEKPEYLIGYADFERWQENSGAFYSLVFDCYRYAIFDKVKNLKERVEKFANIDSLINGNIGRFLSKLQEKHDKVGYTVYKNVEAAIERAMTESIFIDLTATHFNFDPPASPLAQFVFLPLPSSLTPHDFVSVEQLKNILHKETDWSKMCLVVTKRSEAAKEQLYLLLFQLKASKIKAFIRLDLINLLKNEARAAWKAVEYTTEESSNISTGTEESSYDGESTTEIVPTTLLNVDFENHESFKQFVTEVQHAIAQLECQQKVRDRVQAVFQEYVSLFRTDEPIPKQIEVARCLGIKRSSMSEAVKILRNLEPFQKRKSL